MASCKNTPMRSLLWTPDPTIRRSSSTPRAPPGSRRARCTPIASCSATCRACELPHDFLPQPGDLFWTPADWAWIGGLIDVLLPAWFCGLPVLAHRARKFDPEQAFHLMARAPGPQRLPAADRAQADARRSRHRAAPRRSPCARSAAAARRWAASCSTGAARRFGVTINEFYGQTECNLVVGNCAAIMPVRPGSMGRACRATPSR